MVSLTGPTIRARWGWGPNLAPVKPARRGPRPSPPLHPCGPEGRAQEERRTCSDHTGRGACGSPPRKAAEEGSSSFAVHRDPNEFGVDGPSQCHGFARGRASHPARAGCEAQVIFRGFVILAQ